MSAVKYAFLKTFWGFENGTGIDTEVPLIGHELYDRLGPPDGTTLIVNEGDPNGYNFLYSVTQPICKFLEFNPFKLGTFNINQSGIDYNNGMIPQAIEYFMGEYSEATTRNGNYLYPTHTGTNIGYAYYAAGYSTSQAGLGGTKYGNTPSPLLNVIEPYARDSLSNNGIRYTIEIWRPDVISSGYIDTQKFQTDDGLIRVGYLTINIWTLEDKFYYDIRLQSVNYTQNFTTRINTALNQQELGRIYDPANPFDNKQADGDEGGGASSDDGSDPVDVPELPTLDISDLGGFNLYKVSATDVKSLFTYLNSHDPGEAILKWIQNPIQGIISLHVLPYPVTVPGGSGNSITILGIDTGVAGYKVAPYQEWELGGVRVPYGFDNTFLDYEPYTKVAIYLPFIGIKELDSDEVIGQSVTVTYQFDNVSGACIAFVSINGAVRYSFTGSCAMSLPINQQNWGQAYMAAATVAAGALAGGFGAAGAALAQGAGGAEIAASGLMGAVQGSGGFGAIQKPTISRSGCISGAAAALGVPHPYIIIERPTKASAANPAPVSGLISGRTLPLSSLSGYNIIEHVHLHGIAATGPELEEIEKLLYQGVVF